MLRQVLPDHVLARRFTAKLIPEPNTGCWLWFAGHNEHGYGVMWNGARLEKAHRLAYRLYRGIVFTAEDVCHKCDTPACVNPWHMFVADAQANVDDMMAKRRHWTIRMAGEANGAAKLSAADVKQIRELLSMGLKQRDIAARFGVSQSAISMINLDKAWGRGNGRFACFPA